MQRISDQSLDNAPHCNKINNRIKIEHDGVKKIQDIYNSRQNNKLILYASGDKKINILDNHCRDDIEPTQPIIWPIQLSLNTKKHIPNKKS